MVPISPIDDNSSRLVIGVVGPCAGGKTTLITALTKCGFNARHIAQEHSYVKDMWQRISKPDVLIYLDVSYPLSKIRRNMNWSKKEYDQQIERLSHARGNADLFIKTDSLSINQVFKQVIDFLAEV
jgi:deoxyadenosine/deoxycytidine kinase